MFIRLCISKKYHIKLIKYLSNLALLQDISVNQKVMKIVHLTDIHYDQDYEPKSPAKCREPLCCQATSTPLPERKYLAGYWGDYHSCDMPWHSILNLLQQIKKQHVRNIIIR